MVKSTEIIFIYITFVFKSKGICSYKVEHDYSSCCDQNTDLGQGMQDELAGCTAKHRNREGVGLNCLWSAVNQEQLTVLYQTSLSVLPLSWDYKRTVGCFSLSKYAVQNSPLESALGVL